jgi:hypothetical protein
MPAFDTGEVRQARGGLGGEALAIEQLAFERREETLAQGVVVRVTPLSRSTKRGPRGVMPLP